MYPLMKSPVYIRSSNCSITGGRVEAITTYAFCPQNGRDVNRVVQARWNQSVQGFYLVMMTAQLEVGAHIQAHKRANDGIATTYDPRRNCLHGL